MSAFWELSTERQIGMGGVGAIPASQIRAMAKTFGDEAQNFMHCIKQMDHAYLNAVNPKKDGEHRVMKTPLKPGQLKAATGL